MDDSKPVGTACIAFDSIWPVVPKNKCLYFGNITSINQVLSSLFFHVQLIILVQGARNWDSDSYKITILLFSESTLV